MTLLKNDGGLLPLDPDTTRRVALLGPKLKKRNCLPLWGGSAGVWSPGEVTPWQGLQRENNNRFQFVSDPAAADAVLLFVGLSHRPGLDSEVKDRASLELPWQQDALISKTLAVNPNTVVVLMTGSPVVMPWVEEVPAILQCWYPGMEGGTAIARTLFGDNNPCGKLPVTFPRSLGDSPAHRSERTFPGTRKTVHYDEELLVGYRHYDKYGIEPLFPFGHGLSYTRFNYAGLAASSEVSTPEEPVQLTVDVVNEGDRAGDEVVQLYLADLQAEAGRPEQALKGFEKISLQPGECKTVNFTLGPSDFGYFCPAAGCWRTRQGEYEVRIGSSSRDIRLRQVISLEAGA